MRAGPSPSAFGAAANLLSFIEQAPTGMALLDKQMRYIAASRRLLEHLGLACDSALRGRNHCEVFPGQAQAWRERFARVLAGEDLAGEVERLRPEAGRLERLQWRLTPWRDPEGAIIGAALASHRGPPAERKPRIGRPDGSQRRVFGRNAVLKDAAGRRIGLIPPGEDVTEPRAAEPRLRAAESHLRSIFEHAPVGIARL